MHMFVVTYSTIHNTLQHQQLDYQKVKVLWWQEFIITQLQYTENTLSKK